jgi:hypothetical protein
MVLFYSRTLKNVILNNLIKLKNMKRILFFISLFVSVCFAVVSITLSKINTSMSLQAENVEALTIDVGMVVLKTCYLFVTPSSGTGVYYYQCNSATSPHYVIYPCGTKIESTSASYSDVCYYY